MLIIFICILYIKSISGLIQSLPRYSVRFQPTEVTVVKSDGERVSQADLKAAAEAAEAARIASAKAEEERLQAEKLAAEQLAAQNGLNGERSPTTLQDIKVHVMHSCL